MEINRYMLQTGLDHPLKRDSDVFDVMDFVDTMYKLDLSKIYFTIHANVFDFISTMSNT